MAESKGCAAAPGEQAAAEPLRVLRYGSATRHKAHLWPLSCGAALGQQQPHAVGAANVRATHLFISRGCCDQGHEVSPQVALCLRLRGDSARDDASIACGHRCTVTSATALATASAAGIQSGRRALQAVTKAHRRVAHSQRSTTSRNGFSVRPGCRTTTTESARCVHCSRSHRGAPCTVSG